MFRRLNHVTYSLGHEDLNEETRTVGEGVDKEEARGEGWQRGGGEAGGRGKGDVRRRRMWKVGG